MVMPEEEVYDEVLSREQKKELKRKYLGRPELTSEDRERYRGLAAESLAKRREAKRAAEAREAFTQWAARMQGDLACNMSGQYSRPKSLQRAVREWEIFRSILKLNDKAFQAFYGDDGKGDIRKATQEEIQGFIDAGKEDLYLLRRIDWTTEEDTWVAASILPLLEYVGQNPIRGQYYQILQLTFSSYPLS